MDLIVNHLNKLGLTTNEAKAYIALLPLQEAKASQIAASARIPRSKIYETMQSLHKKGFVEVLPEKITKFKVISFDSAVQIYLDGFRKKLESIEETKEKVSSFIRSLPEKPRNEVVGEFTILKSKRIIYKKMESLLTESNRMAYLMLNVSDLRRLYYVAREAAKRIEIRVLAPINTEDKELIKKWMRFAYVHHYETQTQVKLAIQDDTEVMVFHTNEPVSLYSKDRQFTELLKGFFQSSWDVSPLGIDKIAEIETGKPVEEVAQIHGRQEIYDSVRSYIRKAQKDVFINASPAGLLRVRKYLAKDIEDAVKRGVRVKLLSHITKQNAKIAKELNVEVRHTSKPQSSTTSFYDSYMLMMLIRKDTPTLDSPDDYAIVTNQVSTVETMRHMYENVWAGSIPLGARIHELETGKPVEKVEILRGEEVQIITKSESEKASREICTMATELSPETALKVGIADIDRGRAKKGVKVRYIFPITKRNARAVKELMKYAEIRHVDFSPVRIRILDKRDCFVSYGDDSANENACVHSHSLDYVSTMKSYFENVWQGASKAEERLRELETGTPAEKTEVVKGEDNVYDAITDVLLNCGKNLIIFATEHGIQNAASKRRKMLEELKKAGARIRYVARITNDNVETAKDVSKLVELRHYDIPLYAIVTDREFVMIPEVSRDYHDEIVRSNVPGMVTRMRETLENIWVAAVPADERIRQLETGEPLQEVKHVYGRENVYALIPGFVGSSKEDIIWMTSENGVKRLYKNLKPYVTEALRRGVRIRCLTKVTPENMPFIKELGIEVRHIDDVYAIADCYDNSALTIMEIKNDTEDISSPEDTGIITNQAETVKMVRQFLETTWDNAISAESRISELELGTPSREFSRVIESPDEGFQHAVRMVSAAKKSVFISTTSTGLRKLVDAYPFEKLKGRVKINILCPITQQNAETAGHAMKFAEVRHVNETSLRATIVDDKEAITVIMGHDKNPTGSVYSNSKNFVTSAKSFFNGLWNSAVDAKEILGKM